MAPARSQAAHGLDLPRAMPQAGAVDAVPAQPMPAWPAWQAPGRTQPAHQAADAAAETAPPAAVAAPAPAAQAADGAALPTPRPDLAPDVTLGEAAKANANEAAATPAPASAPAVRQADGDQTGPAATASVTPGTATRQGGRQGSQQGPAGRAALAQSDPASQPGTTTAQETAPDATATSDADAAVVQYSRSPDTKAAYESRIDALFGDAKANPQGVRLLDRSDVMGLLGHSNVPLALNEEHVIHDGRTHHPEMTASVWKKVPEWIENPAAVYTDPKHPGRLTLVAPQRLAGYPVIVAIEPGEQRGRGGADHLVVTAFAKTTGELPSLSALASGGRLLYMDTKMAPAVWQRPGDNPRRGHPTSGAKPILTEKQLGGWRAKNNPAYSKETSSDPAATPPQPPATIESVQAAVDTLVGTKGRLRLGLGGVVVTTSERIQPDWEPLVGKVDIGSQTSSRARGFYEPHSKTVFLIADHIPAGHETAVAAHELMHKHGKAVLGAEGWKRLHETLGTWAARPEGSKDRQVHDEAMRRLQAARPADAQAQGNHRSEELFPYAVEVAVEMGVIPSTMRPVTSVQGWLARALETLSRVWTKLSNRPDLFNRIDLVDLAFAIAQQENPALAQGLEGAVATFRPDEEGGDPGLAGASGIARLRDVYIPRDKSGALIPMAQRLVAGVGHVPLPLTDAEGAPHSVLSAKVGDDGQTIYRQTATFLGGVWPPLDGQDAPWSRVDWNSHSYLEGKTRHPDPHHHRLYYDGKQWREANAEPFYGH